MAIVRNSVKCLVIYKPSNFIGRVFQELITVPSNGNSYYGNYACNDYPNLYNFFKGVHNKFF